MRCNHCGQELVVVDNPLVPEIRHRRGEERNCPDWRRQAAESKVDIYGAMFIGDQMLPVNGISLAAGTISFSSTVAGPVDLPEDTWVKIYGRDGHLVLEAPWRLSAELRQALLSVTDDGESIVVFPLKITEMV